MNLCNYFHYLSFKNQRLLLQNQGLFSTNQGLPLQDQCFSSKNLWLFVIAKLQFKPSNLLLFCFIGITLAININFAYAANDNIVNDNVIQLQHQSAKEVKPIVEKFLSEKDSVTVIDNKLIIKTGSSNLAKIKKIIEAIDVAKVTFMISIYQGDDPNNVQYGKKYSTTEITADDNLRTVKVLSGDSAHVSYDKSEPVVTFARGYEDSWQQTEYHKVDNEILLEKTNAESELVAKKFEIEQQHILLENEIKLLRKAATPNPYNAPSYLALQVELDDLERDKEQLEAQIKTLAEQTKFDISKQVDAKSKSGAYAKEYKYLPNGITLKPQMIGNKVELTLIKITNKMDESSKTIKAFNVRTKLTVPLNEWVNITGNAKKTLEKGKKYQTKKLKKELFNIWIKIDKVIP